MPYINNNQELASFLSDIRKSSNITISDLAKRIDKSSGYISNVENLKTTKIDVKTFDKLLKVFSSIKENQDKINSFLSDGLPLNFTEKENEEQHNLIKFDSLYRQITIPKSLIKYISDTLLESNISAQDVIIELNSNRFIKDADKLPKNDLIFIKDEITNLTGFAFVFDVEPDFLQKILDGVTRKLSYIYLQGIIYALKLKQGFSQEEATEESANILKSNKIYTLRELRRIKADEQINEEFKDEFKSDTKLPSEYVEYRKTLKKLILFLNFLNDRDSEYTTSRLTALYKNLTCPATSNITLGFIGLPLIDLSVLPFEKQREVFQKCKDIILKATQEKSENHISIERIE